MKNEGLKRLILAALFLALGFVFPFLTGQLKSFGNMLLPMHIPVFLCGLICGWKYGILVGFMLPILRSVIMLRPEMTDAVAMAFELLCYGGLSGFMYEMSPWKCTKALYKALITSMIAGRLVWGVVKTVILGLGVSGFTFGAFITGGFINALPGILLQLILIPAIMVALKKAKLVPLGRGKREKVCKN